MIAYTLYLGVYFLLFSLLQILRPFLAGKIRRMIEEKNLGYFRSLEKRIPSRPLWIHAASGEIEYAKPLIRELKQQHPQCQILVTFSSPSAIPIIEKLPEVDFWGPAPWDLPWEMQRFLNHWQPRALFIARTDAWPTMVYSATKKHHIPAYIFAATFAKNSSRLKWPTSLLQFFIFKQLQQIFCVNNTDATNLRESGYREQNLQILGDTRFDQVFHRLENPKELKLSLKPDKKTWIWGSTWPADEFHLTPLVSVALQKNMQIIIAPHECSPQHLATLEKQIGEACPHARVTRYSLATSSSWDVLIVDVVGILAELYTWADVAFVGGSFKAQVHSVMEPLAAGLPVVVGPFYQNNREALLFQDLMLNKERNLHAVEVVHNSTEIQQWLTKILHLENLQEAQHQLREKVRQEQGSTSRLLSQLPQRIFE